MGNLKYLLMLALTATLFASCSKDDDNDDLREAIVGSYDVTGTFKELSSPNGNGQYDTTTTTGVTYVMTISLPAASDNLPSDYVLIRNIANNEVNGDIASSLTNDVLVFDPAQNTSREVSGTATIDGNTLTASVSYVNSSDYFTYVTFTAIKRN